MTDDQERVTPKDLAWEAAEAIRGLNHLSTAFRFPSDVYDVLGALSMLAGGLPQTIQQLASFLERQIQDGVVAIDAGDRFEGDPLAAVSEAVSALVREAGPAAATMQVAIDRAQQAIAGAHYIESKVQ